MDGATLTAATQGVLEQALVSAIPVSGAATVEVNLALAPGHAPPVLSNHITYAALGVSAHMAAVISSYDVQGPDLAVSPFHLYLFRRNGSFAG